MILKTFEGENMKSKLLAAFFPYVVFAFTKAFCYLILFFFLTLTYNKQKVLLYVIPQVIKICILSYFYMHFLIVHL